ncbi:response regulator receiver domain-containing protein [Chitinophaga dinghuensis]|uniref:Response regulator receiver domain-containing protein n=1 Tax=Chitinophaga dinghuensis TaxID=1539050 RepID=A0A327W9M1_9BACT|nr:response regulator [Chitinophaga dinghuensis]RAJ87407.1 response regulator receiver domain-containing protein [Chitinophaga dinghuensis]
MQYRCAIVDDEPLAIELLSNYLERMDHMELVIATDKLQDVSELIKSRQIDLILLDVNIYGRQTSGLNQLMKNADCRFIVVTAYPLASLGDIPLGGRHGYLPKPVSFPRFKEKVTKMLKLA